MKKLFAFTLGLVAGFAAAHYLSQTDQGKSLLASAQERISDAKDAFSAGFQERTAEIQGALGDLKNDLLSES
ncbi:MAG: hypothetical protein LKF88_05460 [Microbacteriaceae bacterium]|jgi:hypothetical protein|nr:hypothetical protein [Microbacteriaceae bacterium]MCI1207593.1 hypothetical protein [Microbacteriaceae bacterium]